MIDIKLGDRYAKSIFELARERGEMEKVEADFELIEKVCRQNPDFTAMLRSPLVFSDKKQAVIDSIFKGKLSTITTELIRIIVRKKREAFLLDIAVRFQALYDAKSNITRGVLTSAAALPAEMKARIKSMIEKELTTTFTFEEKIDPELIGGFVLRIGDYQFDGSIASGLRKLQNEFDSNPYVKEY